MSSSEHFFLVIEGLDGSGKSEVSRRLVRLLRQTLGERVKGTFEPHDSSAAGLFIRGALAKRVPASPYTLALAYALNRADHNQRVIEPFLNAEGSRLLVCDRYYLSSLVYQSTAEQPMEAVMLLNRGARVPNLTLFLDASEETCYARMGARGGSRELFDERLAEMRAKYTAAIEFLRGRGEKIVIVNADSTLLDVLNSIIDVLNEHAPSWLTMQRLLLLDESTPIHYAPNSQATLNTLRGDRHDTSLDDLSAPVLADFLIAVLRDSGYTIGDRLSWAEMVAYRLDYTLPLGMTQRGALLLLTDPARAEHLTRRLQENDTAREFDFLIVFNPEAEEGETRVREMLTWLSPSVRVMSRADVISRVKERIQVLPLHGRHSPPPFPFR